MTIARLFLRIVLAVARQILQSRADLVLENLALRQQLATYARERPKPSLNDVDRAFWLALREQLEHWAEILVVVKPSTVIHWHR
jgi:hypothetical protein